MADTLAAFIDQVQAIDFQADGTTDQIIQALIKALGAMVDPTVENDQADWQQNKRQKTFSFSGLRSAITDIVASFPDSLQEFCQGLVFAAEVLRDALAVESSLVHAGKSVPNNFLLCQLAEPVAGDAFISSERSVSRLQCVEVLAAGFFGVIRRNKYGWQDTCTRDMQEFTFEKLWEYDSNKWGTKNLVLMGVLLYFQHASVQGKEALDSEHIKITRKAVGADVDIKAETLFCPFELEADGVSIHKYEGEEHLQADFANEYLGGAVLGGGGSQEESMFMEYTELMVTMFLVEKMLSFESVEISGLKKYLEHNMMAARHLRDRSAQFCRLAVGGAEVTTVAFDAICFNAYGKLSKWDQYKPELLMREMRKCLSALSLPAGGATCRNFVTGNWGCGAFRGDLELKCIIQWICCSIEPSIAKLIYCPWDSHKALEKAGIMELVNQLPEKVSVKMVLGWLCDPSFLKASSAFRYILGKLGSV